MKIKLSQILIAMNVLTLGLVLVMYLSSLNILRIILGIPFLLFIPGYTLVAALFLDSEEMTGIKRVALSFGLSIAVVPLIGFILNYTPWGIRLEPVLYSVAIFVFVTSVIAWSRLKASLRQMDLPAERHVFELRLKAPARGKGVADQMLTIIMVIVIIGALGTAANFMVKSKAAEQYTQFYILGQEDRQVDYPRELKVGQESKVTVVITNNEGTDVSYRVQVLIDGNKSTEVGPEMLVDKQEWQTDVGFVPKSAGMNQKVEFMLYKNDETKPYLEPLYLWINVSE